MSDLEDVEAIKQVVIPDDEDGMSRVYEYDDDGNLKSIRTVFMPKPTQETERPSTDITEAGWEEHKHPRDPEGKFAGSGGAQAAERPVESKFKQTYENLKQFDENPDGMGFESIEISENPTMGQQATAYYTLDRYPDMDEAKMLQQSVRADVLRQAATATNTATQAQLGTALPFAKVSGRVKSRKSMLTKLGKKRKYDTVDQLADISGTRVMTQNIVENEIAQEYVRQNFDVVQEQDRIQTPLEGYRAIHFDIRNPDGTVSEMQVRTANQDKWAEKFHDTVYKVESLPPDQRAAIMANIEQLKQYGQQMSDYYYQADLGRVTPMPVCPPMVQQVIGCL